MAKVFRNTLLLLACCFCLPARAQIAVTDDTGQLVKLPAPAQRIVSLAPHITELLFAAGAGQKIVGAMEGSDYPSEARRIPRVGGPSAIDLEALLALKPDLVVAWASGNPPAQIAKLRALGVPIFMSEPRKLEDIGTSLTRLGTLAGTRASAQAAGLRFKERQSALPKPRAGTPPVRVFYQIWQAPLMTINDQHIISDVLRTCGAENVFGGESVLTPTISMEAAIAANPELLVSTRPSRAEDADWARPWLTWIHISAVARQNFCDVTPDWMSRAGPRLIDGAEELCACVEKARLKRPASAPPAPRRSQPGVLQRPEAAIWTQPK